MACSISGTFCGNDAGFCLNRRKKDESAEYYSGNFNWYLVFIFCNYDNEERKQLWELQYLPGAALRLGKFNIDPRQSSSFIGMPTPANALFWGSLTVGAHSFLISDSFNAAYLFILVVIMSLLLVAEIPMFSLKFKSLAWKQNKVSYIFLIVCIPLLAFFKISSFAAIILWYIILSLLTKKRA